MEPVEVGTARSGEPTAAIGSLRIHSAYDPKKEAERFLDNLEPESRPGGVILVLGAGLGYLDAALKARFPESRLIAFHLDAVLHDSRIAEAQDGLSVARWHPGTESSPAAFLEGLLEEWDLPGLITVEWPGSSRARPGIAAEVGEAVQAAVRRHAGNISATAAFGRRWIRNLMRNYLELGSMIQPSRTDDPIVLAASGPSLERCLPAMGRYRDRYTLWALPSALPALARRNLVPDLVVSTDAGYWANLHTRHFPPSSAVAMPLSAIPPGPGCGPVMVLAQGIPGEDYLLDSSFPPVLAVPEMGTVAATALELWKRLAAGPLLIAGLDLAWDDLRSHARPHAFDGWLESRANRTSPALTVAWERAALQVPGRSGRRRTGGALATYADWFSGESPQGRVFRFRPGIPDESWTALPGLPDADENWFEGLEPLKESGRAAFPTVPSPDRDERIKAVESLLAHWRSISNLSAPTKESSKLMYYLDPGGVLDAGRRRGEEALLARKEHRQRVMSILEGLERRYG